MRCAVWLRPGRSSRHQLGRLRSSIGCSAATGISTGSAAAWQAVACDYWGAAQALRIWYKHGEQARAKSEQILADLLRHPQGFSEQLVILRRVHTLALLDLLNYRQHVYHAAEYASDGEPPDAAEPWAHKAAAACSLSRLAFPATGASATTAVLDPACRAGPGAMPAADRKHSPASYRYCQCLATWAASH